MCHGIRTIMNIIETRNAIDVTQTVTEIVNFNGEFLTGRSRLSAVWGKLICALIYMLQWSIIYPLQPQRHKHWILYIKLR